MHIFDLALQWHNEFPAEKFLGKHLILPGKEYFVEDIHWAIKDELYGKIPAIDCDHSNETLKPTILSKITLCFNLKLQLIHCRPKMFPQGIFGHCPRRSLVDYPKDADDISSWSKTGNSSLLNAIFHSFSNAWMYSHRCGLIGGSISPSLDCPRQLCQVQKLPTNHHSRID